MTRLHRTLSGLAAAVMISTACAGCGGTAVAKAAASSASTSGPALTTLSPSSLTVGAPLATLGLTHAVELPAGWKVTGAVHADGDVIAFAATDKAVMISTASAGCGSPTAPGCYTWRLYARSVTGGSATLVASADELVDQGSVPRPQALGSDVVWEQTDATHGTRLYLLDAGSTTPRLLATRATAGDLVVDGTTLYVAEASRAGTSVRHHLYRVDLGTTTTFRSVLTYTGSGGVSVHGGRVVRSSHGLSAQTATRTWTGLRHGRTVVAWG